ncbi:aldehyde ferredoxin oxidoreductase N-terminal domain-containing protein [Desulfovibrio ferrophilus]|uniref:Aldehyde ferredoxin oxidoreductase n=1 Tax=Desulfovibrio ferrophilus TaxID=241368 RepID=A0A2Z6B040_9BACT|nr:aldehyde ferredoxin oxidoreductase N-terminal domain-containing protein [Desulfovibrio ferrophilus]BBD08887.1 aldehyde ferredoxin oxidoreductase [Desulfovibrio ferrophilus]
MSNRPFHIMHVDMQTGRGERSDFLSPAECLGGSGLAAKLYEHFGHPELPALHPDQPLIFAIGPLTGHFPLMSKVVCGFKSPYNEQYAESHAGGRLALSMRFAGYDALVVTGRSERLSSLFLAGRGLRVEDVEYMRGRDVFTTGKYLRRRAATAGHRSIFRIGPAGENLCSYACINVDSFRHFGRLGSGAVMGAKNLKAVVVEGDRELPLAGGKDYKKLFKAIYSDLTGTDMMSKYHNLGTAENLLALNELSALPWNNLQKTKRPEIDGISGERIAEQLLLRQTACAGCPVGCIHIGLLREKFASENEYLYRQVSYDYEPVFACGSMLGLTNASDVLAVLDACERQGMDVMSAGVALAWAAEALEKGLISEQETLLPLAFGDSKGFIAAMDCLGGRTNEFYEILARGAMVAAEHYGGEDFACVLGQEMAGYATGEVFYVSQAMGFRHSHLDSGGYSYDQSAKDKDVDKAVKFMVDDERGRVMLTSMVSCLFARKIYSNERVAEALSSVGLQDTATNLEALAGEMQRLRWRLKLTTGFDPTQARVPKRFMEVVTWKGAMDPKYLAALQEAYSRSILDLGANPS